MKQKKSILTVLILILAMSVLLMGCSGGGSKASYKAGTYDGKAEGYAGDINVKVTVTEDKITDVTVEDNQETPEVGGEALKTLAAAVVEKQSADVDVVSGATVTSEAFIKAVKDALSKAK